MCVYHAGHTTTLRFTPALCVLQCGKPLHYECIVQCAPAVCSVPMHVVCYSVDCALHFECPCSVGIPCCSDNTLLSGTFRPSASPSESPAPSYIHLLHFERERENEKKDSQRFA